MCTAKVNFFTCSSFFPCSVKKQTVNYGELAQLARASALQAEGQGFESPILQKPIKWLWDSSSVG